MDQPLREQIVSEKTLYEGRAYDFLELTLEREDGSTRPRPIVRHRGAAVIVPILEQAGRSPKIVFVRNERHTINGRLLELPAGGIDPGESPEETAHRELLEETGYTAATVYDLGRFYTTPGITDELMHVYAATSMVLEKQDLQDDETLTVEVLTLSEVERLIDSNEMIDGKSILALLLAQRKGYLEFSS